MRLAATMIRSVGITTLSTLACAVGLALTQATPSSAQAAYGSYIGGGISFGLNDGGSSSGDSEAGGVIAVRYRFLEAPISIRTQVLISDTTAVVPTVSYDIPLSWNTDAYIGAGVAFQDGDADSASPIGNQTSFVIQPGIDHSFPNSHLVVFGNAIFAFDAYRESGDTGVALQTGLGLRF